MCKSEVRMGLAKCEIFYKTEVSDEEDCSPIVSEEPNDQVEIIDCSKRKSSNDSQEYYMLIMMPIAPKSWVVAKHHGWWDDDGQQPKLTTMLLNTTNEPLTESQAIRLYLEQRSYLLNQGFVYIVGPSGEPVAAS
jgi:hypothetical protein